MRIRLPRIADAKDHLLTAVILIAALALMTGRHQGAVDNLRKASITFFSYLEEPLSNIRIYQQALKTNTHLRRQNVQLMDELNRLRAAEQQNERLRTMLEFEKQSELPLHPVRVVGKEMNQINNSLTIDAGSNEGIEQGMPLISTQGLVGKVILTASGHSQVMPLFHTLFRASAKLQRSNTFGGIVTWSGGSLDEMQLDYLPQTAMVDTGDVVVTSGYSNHFPANLPIGTVTRIESRPGKETIRVFLKPYVNFHQISEGFVVTTRPDTALKELNENFEELLQ